MDAPHCINNQIPRCRGPEKVRSGYSSYLCLHGLWIFFPFERTLNIAIILLVSEISDLLIVQSIMKETNCVPRKLFHVYFCSVNKVYASFLYMMQFWVNLNIIYSMMPDPGTFMVQYSSLWSHQILQICHQFCNFVRTWSCLRSFIKLTAQNTSVCLRVTETIAI